MKTLLLVSMLLLIKLTIADVVDTCDQQSKLIYYGATICDVQYEHCTEDNSLTIDTCIGYRCRLEINGECYYYSYQIYDKRRCMSQCCGYSSGPGATYTSEQISQCLSLNFYQNSTPTPEGVFNKLPIILGSVLGSVFFVILITCICCRHKIKTLWQSEDPQEIINRPNRRSLRESTYEMESNNIHFIMENSDHNLVYDQQIECTICLSNSNDIQTACGHWFHFKCLGHWCEKNLKCPNCMSQQFNPVRVFCSQCHKPYVQLKLNRKNRLHSLKKRMGQICKTCYELKS